MKDKLLFLIVRQYYNFFLAKFIQEKYDCDLYGFYNGVYSGDEIAKEFLEKKNLVNFKKIWYYQDYVSSEQKEPIDIKYLIKFEKRYGINLWSMAYSDRLFYKFNMYYKFSYEEILLILQQECKLFEKILDEVKPTYLIDGGIEGPHQFYFLDKICQARKIKVLKIQPTKMASRYFISINGNNPTIPKELSKSGNIGSENKIKYKDFLEKYDNAAWLKDYQTTIKNPRSNQIKNVIKFFVKPEYDTKKVIPARYGKTKAKILWKLFRLSIKKRRIRNYENKHFLKKIEKDTPFVYFPLHVEPEKVLLIDSPYYTNQIEVINHIAKSLPVKYKLFVKDHPASKIVQGRSISFYEQIRVLPNVEVLHSSIPKEEILENCSLVTTIRGTTGFEAALFQKPTIVFSNVDYSFLPSVSIVNKIEDLPKLIRKCIEEEVDTSILNFYLENMLVNSFEFNLLQIVGDLFVKYFDRGFEFHMRKPSDSELNIFIEENKNTFNLLSSEFVKKINECKMMDSTPV